MRKPVFGAAAATVSGCLVAYFTLQLLSLSGHDHSPPATDPFIGICILIAVTSSAVFVPLYLEVPRSNFLWKPSVCVPLGALAGYLALFTVGTNGRISEPLYYFKWSYVKQVWPGSIVGATIWLVATKTYYWFHLDEGASSPACTETKLPSIWRWLFLFSITSQAGLRAIFCTGEVDAGFYNHYDPSNHPIRATFISCLLNLTGLFLLIFTPRFFHRLGFIAVLAWLLSVLAFAEYLGFSFFPIVY